MWGVTSTPGAVQSGWPSGSGSGSVTSRANRSRPGLGQHGVGVEQRPAADVDHERVVGEPGQERRVDDVPGGVAEREYDDHDVLGGPVDVGGGHHPADQVVVARRRTRPR